MTTKEKFLLIGGLILGAALVAFLIKTESPSNSLGSVYGTPSFVTTSTATQATTTLYAFAGILHTVSVTNPVANSVITIYDSATTTSPTIAPIVITIPSSTTIAPFTLTFDGIFNNGFTIKQATATSTVTVTYQQN